MTLPSRERGGRIEGWRSAARTGEESNSSVPGNGAAELKGVLQGFQTLPGSALPSRERGGRIEGSMGNPVALAISALFRPGNGAAELKVVDLGQFQDACFRLFRPGNGAAELKARAWRRRRSTSDTSSVPGTGRPN